MRRSTGSSVLSGLRGSKAWSLAGELRELRLQCIPDICHGPTGQARGEKICHVEKFHISVHFLHIGFNFKFLHMTDVEKSEISFIVCTIYGILLHFTLFC